jgi:hypothetical protein
MLYSRLLLSSLLDVRGHEGAHDRKLGAELRLATVQKNWKPWDRSRGFTTNIAAILTKVMATSPQSHIIFKYDLVDYMVEE